MESLGQLIVTEWRVHLLFPQLVRHQTVQPKKVGLFCVVFDKANHACVVLGPCGMARLLG